jgi:RNA polymerase sigma-70 factor (ECF subfamily)
MDSLAAEIYTKYADELIRYASGLVGPSGAEDVMAAACARVLFREDLGQIEDVRPYLYRAVLNEARSQHRSTQRRLKRESSLGEQPVDSDSPAFVVRAEVLDAIRRLGVRERAVVYLTYWVDLQVDEIAARLGLSVRTVARDLARGRKRMEELLT